MLEIVSCDLKCLSFLQLLISYSHSLFIDLFSYLYCLLHIPVYWNSYWRQILLKTSGSVSLET